MDFKGSNLSLQGNTSEDSGENTGENNIIIPKIGVPQNGWFIMEHPIKIFKMDDFGGTIIFGNTHIIHTIFGCPQIYNLFI